MYLSPEFALGFLVFFAVYWLLARYVAWQNYALLVFSFLFYGSLDVRMAVSLGLFSLTVYFVAGRIRGALAEERRAWLIVGLVALVGYLGLLKYYLPLRDLLAQTLPGLAGVLADLLALDILVPLGVSFYTFQAVALLVACYRNATVCQRLTLTETALFLAFFPTVLAGPIARPEHMLPQLRLRRRFVAPERGLGLIARGLFKKLVVANWLAEVWVDPLFANPSAFNGVELALGAAAYSIQIYADFSGLTDLVRGIAWLLGFRLPENFNLPYLSRSPRDFWHRWHISLSSWIRDYIYIPLGGNRQGVLRTQLNLLLAMVVSGAWHGASANLIVWGFLHGGACILVNLWPSHLTPATGWRVTLTFIFVTFAWIFFRAASLDQAFDYLSAMTRFQALFTYNVVGGALLLLLFFMIQFHVAQRLPQWVDWLSRPAWPVQFAGLTAFVWLCIEWGPSGVPAFIYFKY